MQDRKMRERDRKIQMEIIKDRTQNVKNYEKGRKSLHTVSQLLIGIQCAMIVAQVYSLAIDMPEQHRVCYF